jgi:hypothetical protein
VARERARGVRAALTDAALAGVGPAAGGVSGVGPAAGSMAAEINLAVFEPLLRARMAHRAMPMDEDLAFIGDRRTYRPVLGVSPFGHCCVYY